MMKTITKIYLLLRKKNYWQLLQIVTKKENWLVLLAKRKKSPASGCGSVDAYQTENIVNTGEEDEDSTGTIVKF